MKTEKTNNVITIVLVVCLLCLISFLDYEKKEAQNNFKSTQIKLDSIQKITDSLSNELLYYEIQLDRYETAYKILLRRNPRAAEQYGNIISDETE